MCKYVLSFLLILFMTCSAFGAIDTLVLRRQYNSLQSLAESGQCHQLQRKSRELLSQLEGTANPSLDILIGLYHQLGDCALDKGQYQDAKQAYLSADSLGKRMADTPPLLVAESQHKLGNFYLETKQYSLALPLLERALNGRKDVLGPWHPKIADSYVNLGICAHANGDFEKALDYHQQALAMRSDLQPDELPKLAQCHNNIGLCYEDQQNFASGKRAYHAALLAYQSAYGEQHPKVADVLLNLGNVYGAEGRIDSFIIYQQKALHIWQSLYGQDYPLVAVAYNNLANAYDELGESERALQLFGQALAIQQAIYGPIHPDVATTHFNRGLTYAWLERWDAAQEAFALSFEALNFRPDRANAFEQVNDPILLLRILKVAAGIPKRKFQQANEIRFLEEAAGYFAQADQLIDYLRTSYEATASKLALAQTAQAIYADAVHLATTLGDLTENRLYYEQAYAYAEKSKGILLLEALQAADAATFAKVPEERTMAIQNIETQIGDLETQLFLLQQKSGAAHKIKRDSLSNLLFQQKQELSREITSLEKDYPDYYQLRYATTSPSVAVLQEEFLADNESIVEYFLGQRFLYIFVINRDDFQVISVAIPSNFRSVIRSYNNNIRNFPYVPTTELLSNIEGYARAAHYLYQQLIAPISQLLKEKLIVIPDQELGYLAFEALLQEVPENLSLFKAYPYLIKDYTISYNYSTGLLEEMQKRSAQVSLKPYLGFSPRFEANHSKGLTALQYSEIEVAGIKDQLGGQIFTGKVATKAKFLAEQAHYRILHLATHGKANDAYGDYSFLAFTENQKALGDEALLFVREIYNLSTHAELIVLSACETGTGKLQKGEGIASIARSFSYAGAKSLVASHWSVDDKATSLLMHSFFAFIKEGKGKDEALRAAKLDFIQKGKHKDVHPFFWASFVPIGNMDPIELSAQTSLIPWLIAISLLATAVFLMLKTIRKS